MPSVVSGTSCPAFSNGVSILTVWKRIPRAARLPLPLILLSLCVAGGILLGYGLALRRLSDMSEELRRYFDGYVLLAREVSPAAALRTLLCYFRAPLLAFLLGFASIGVVLLPLLCAFEGFLFSFSLCCFASALGRADFVLVLALFALRMLIVLPAMLCLSVSAMDKAKALALLSVGGGKRVRGVSYGAAYWYRFGIVCLCLFIGSVLELWLVPQFLALAAA